MTNVDVCTAEHASTPVPQKSPSPYLQRVLAIAAVAVAPWVLPTVSLGGDVIAGSRSVFVIVVPVLAWLLVASFEAPSGVVDNEVDWIVALLSCTTAVVTIALFSHRLPSLMQLWRIDVVGPVLWTATASAVFLGVRYAAQLWDLWLLLLVFASPFPFLLLVSVFGGSDHAVVGLSCGIAALVVARATRSRPLGWIGAGLAMALGLGGSAAWLAMSVISNRHTALVAGVIVGSGLVPVLVTQVVLRIAPAATRRGLRLPAAKLPTMSRWGVIALLGLSAVMVAVLPRPPHQPFLPLAASTWTQLSGLKASKDFKVATALLGPYANFTRYVSAEPLNPPAAVDVITAPTRGILDDFAAAQWYASSEPIDFVSTKIGSSDSVFVRSAHSNADTAVDPTAPQWYLLTWMWRVDGGFQQVIVLVSQHQESRLPSPTGITATEVVLDPLLWIARQQPRLGSEVEQETIDLAHQLATQAIAAGLSTSGGRVD